jgi:hypothetical protein
VIDHVAHPHKTTGKITVLILKFFKRRQKNDSEWNSSKHFLLSYPSIQTLPHFQMIY